MAATLNELSESADFAPGDRVKTLRGSLHGIITRILDDGRIVWQPAHGGSELIALPESLSREEASP